MNKLHHFFSPHSFSFKVIRTIALFLTIIASSIAMEHNAFMEQKDQTTGRTQVDIDGEKRLEGSIINTLFWGPYFHVDSPNLSELGEMGASVVQEWAEWKCGASPTTKI